MTEAEEAQGYTDELGVFHLVAACGHHITGAVKSGDRVVVCPNCSMRLRLGKEVDILYPKRLPEDLRYAGEG